MSEEQATATARAERILALAAVVARVGAAVMLLASLGSAPPHGASVGPVLVLTAAAMGETAWYVRITLRRAVVNPLVAGVDALVTAALLWPGGLLVAWAAPGHGSPAYNYLTIAATATGLARWPIRCSLGAASVLGAAVLAHGLTIHDAGYPGWNAPPDAIGPAGVVVVATVIARLARDTAIQLDEHQSHAIRDAAALAEERERLGQAQVLRGPLLVTLERLAAGKAVSDRVIRDQLRVEVAWLHEVANSGLVSVPTALLPALRQLVAARSAQGMRLTALLPTGEPDLGPSRIEALVEAAREALTNVSKHAGTNAATLSASIVDDGMVVEVVDEGQGFDVRARQRRVGLASSIDARLAEVGGRAEIVSAPGVGTRVRLWIPAGGAA